MVLKAVRQEDMMGCAIACVACVAGISYADSRKLFMGFGDPNKTGYACRHIVEALSKVGLNCGHHKIKDRITWKEGMIVFICRCERYPVGHYLTYTKKGWMDPWINMPEIINVTAGFQSRLPGKATYVVFPADNNK